MADIFDEISEDLRRQKMQRLWADYGKYLIAGIVLIILAVGLYEYWKHHSRVTAERDSAAFSEAVELIERGDTAAGLAALRELQENAGGGYRFLAGLREADLVAGQGDQAAAIAVFERIAADSKIEGALRDYAELQAITHALERGETGDLRPRLEALAQPGAPWAPLAEEQLAFLDLKAGNMDRARERLQAIAANEEAPASLRDRANSLIAVVWPGRAAPAAGNAADQDNESGTSDESDGGSEQ